MAEKLGRDAFLALAAVIWSDGKVTAEEADALVVAAGACGVAGADLDAVAHAARDGSELASIGDLTLAPGEQLLVYGLASWLAGVDGTTTVDETATLAALADAFGLTREQRARAAAAAAEKHATHDRTVRALAAALAG